MPNRRTTGAGNHDRGTRRGHLNRTATPSNDWIRKLTGQVTVLPNGCWQYRDGTVAYPGLKIEGRREPIHRLVYLSINGPIPPKHDVHHECENTSCINPEHLVALTRREHRARHARSA